MSEDSLAGRLGRYARVGIGLSGVAARAAGAKYLGMSLDRSKHAADLRAALGGLKGPLMKAAQLIATIPDALPEEYVRELRSLQAQAPSMGWSFVKRRMKGELGADWQSRFAAFEPQAAAAASLGQVHRARLHDGRVVACKLQYPDMRSALEADLGQLKIVFHIGQRMDPAFDTGEIHAEIGERLREELDYGREAAAMRLYADLLQAVPQIHVPGVVPELSTQRLLTMDWLEGRPLLDFVGAAQQERDRLAETMFRAWYRPLYHFGVIHGDPHLGNYTVRPDLSVNLFDYGCIRIFPPRFVRGSIILYRALQKGDEDMAEAAYQDWGFGGLSRQQVRVLNRWAAFLYDPLMDDRVRTIADVTPGRYGRDVIQGVFDEIRKLGKVRPPREFVFMDRAAIGLGAVFIHLRASINWHQLFESLIEGFDVDVLAQRQQTALVEAGL